MRCPHCTGSTLHGGVAGQGVLVEVCRDCRGLWLDRGQIYEFSTQPQTLAARLAEGLRNRQPGQRLCPRCDCAMQQGQLPDREVTLDECPQCGGWWFDAGELDQALRSGPQDLQMTLPVEPPPETDPAAQARAHERFQGLAAGLLALPNLFLRSAMVMVLLYGILGLVLISLVQFELIGPSLALTIGVVVALLQFSLGPWIMDLTLAWVYDFRWITPQQLPEHLRLFVERVCAENRMKFPSFGLINDGAPTAFTFGHHPNNARVVISKGILNLLEPDEVEAVVAHELGHARNWDMALMTMANLVPLLLYYLYRIGVEFGVKGDKDNKAGWVAALIAVGAYVLYIVSEYIVLWFSRTREYYADRFAGQATGKPNALASALVKIAYGLAAQGRAAEEEAAAETDKGQRKERQGASIGAMGALNIFDHNAAVGLVMSSAVGRDIGANRPNVEQIKSAMQWDLWNPWAKFYELHSTHPLVAKRLLYLADQAAHLNQEPLVIFDRRQPESYWDDFLVDVVMMWLPTMAFLLGLGGTIGIGLWQAPALGMGPLLFLGFGVALFLCGLAGLSKIGFSYRRDFFPYLSVAALLHKVKVSAVRPVPATLTGTIIGKGVPGLVWSEDFVMRDSTGILFLDYRQPLAIWNFLFGLFRAGQYQGKEVRVSGWFRRAPVPYLEVNHIETLDGSLPPRTCYSYHTQLIVAAVLVIAGIVLAAVPFLF